MTRLLLIIALLWQASVQAEMVDTFKFQSEADRLRALDLAKSLRCPQCQNQNLAESNATQAFQLRLEVYEMVDQGKSNQQIIDSMVSRFGDFVYYKPPINRHTWLLWGLPFVLLFGLFSAIIWRTTRKKA